MKVLLRILAVLFLILALGLFVILGMRNLSDGSNLEQMKSELQTTLQGSNVDDNALLKNITGSLGSLSAGQFTRGGLACLLLATLILVFIFLTLAGKKALLAKATLAILAVSVLTIFLNPHFSSTFGPASSRILATVGAGLALIGAGLAMLWAKRTQAA